MNFVKFRAHQLIKLLLFLIVFIVFKVFGNVTKR